MSKTAISFLEEAAQSQRDRAALRDTPEGERSMARTVAAFNAITGHNLSETEGWVFMNQLKMVRGSQGQYHADDWVDLVSYSALAAESEDKARSGGA